MGVPSLVRIATAHRVGAHCINFVPRSLVSAGHTCVVLVDPMTMGLAIVSQKGLFGGCPHPVVGAATGDAPPLLQTKASRSREQGDQSHEQQVGSRKLLKYCVVI